MVNSSNDSSDDKDSEELAPLFGIEVLNGSPTFSYNNDQMADSPTDNEVSKYSFYSRLTHYMKGHKISESNRAAVKICLLSETGNFVRNMDPMKKDIKERAFFAKYISIVHEIEDDQFVNKALARENMRQRYKGAKKDHTAQSLWRKCEQELTFLRTFAKKIGVLAIWWSCQVVHCSSGTRRCVTARGKTIASEIVKRVKRV